ncbi:hypothetical protein CBF23_003535 [Marinomonas agarivorans]|nr:hypothetical protein CBF23_003535 [Marinomonas agarivorans]
MLRFFAISPSSSWHVLFLARLFLINLLFSFATPAQAKLSNEIFSNFIIDHTETHTTDSTTWQGTNLSAGNLTINANDDVSILASDLVVEDNLAIKADDVTIGDRQDVIVTSEEEITKTTTFSLEVKNAYADVHHAERALNQADKAVRQAKRDYDSAKQLVKDGKLPASDLDFYKANIAAAELNRVNAAVALASTVKAAAKTAATSAGTGFYASVGVSTQTDKSKTSTTESISNGSSISVGGNATLTSQDDLTIKGSDVNVSGTLELDAQDTQILAGQNTTHTTTESSSHGANASVTNSGSVSVGVNANQANSASQSKTHTNSQISAGTIASNSDSLSIKGANVHADDIQIHTDNLEIASLQNTSSRESQSAGGHIGFGSEGFVPDSYGVNMSKGEAERNWVDQQTTLTGENVNIQAKDTTITGATIAAIDENGNDNGNLNLSTDNLVVENITDIDNAKDMSIGYSTSGINKSEEKKNVSSTDKKVDDATNTYSASFTGHEREQITKATLGSGNIAVGGESIDNDSQFDDLNRDITNSQQLTKDMQRGGLNASVTIDNRILSAEGWEDIARDVKAGAMHAQDIARAVDTVLSSENASLSELGKAIRNNAIFSELRNDLERSGQLAGIRAALNSDDPDVQAQGKQAVGMILAQRLGLDKGTTINLFDGDKTTSDSLANNDEKDVKGAVVNDESNSQHGNVFIDAGQSASEQDIIAATAHETLQALANQGKDGGIFFDSSDAALEDLRNAAGEQFADRLNSLITGGLDTEGNNISNSSIVQQGTDAANQVGDANVDYSADMFDFSKLYSNDYLIGQGEQQYEATKEHVVENLDETQETLGYAGLVPGIGNVADGANVGISLLRGEYGEAGLNGIAMLPLIGQGVTAGKVSTKLVDPSIWTFTKNKSSVENAFGHFKKHKNEFPELQNAKQYVEATKKFLHTPPKGTLTKINSRGDTLRYNPSTNTFGVLSKDGSPRTMFRPKDGIDYWNKQ